MQQFFHLNNRSVHRRHLDQDTNNMSTPSFTECPFLEISQSISEENNPIPSNDSQIIKVQVSEILRNREQENYRNPELHSRYGRCVDCK